MTPFTQPEYQDTAPISLIALSGLAGAGKDTAANVLVTHAGFSSLAFADPLRNEVAQAYQLRSDETGLLTNRSTKETPTARLAIIECDSFGFTGAVARATGATVDDEWLHTPRSPRQVLQWWGTEYRRQQRSNYWTNQMLLRIKSLVQAGQRRFVITDCRFENEATAVRRLGGIVWQVTRPAAEEAATEGQHASVNDGSTLLPTVVIRNRGDLLDLRAHVLAAWWSMEANVVVERVEIAA